MNDFFRADQDLWWDEFVAEEVHQMRQTYDTEQIAADIKDFDLDVPF